ncbi:hypothetical protein NEOLEDRAFT_509392 [Neolentinus lepideus HHB14362 ss-1]|uniref:Uncharacterized protein n=1 Tax=Neolentinus lepideus HHB14362 ss-1 TaxID=1314782 RepID=A0A165RL56_9AGAM|nr:hypothetical protein NEOLEDRAFT_509392 [Neolentinus lepideus HHB14362 ss-1]
MLKHCNIASTGLSATSSPPTICCNCVRARVLRQAPQQITAATSTSSSTPYQPGTFKQKRAMAIVMWNSGSRKCLLDTGEGNCPPGFIVKGICVLHIGDRGKSIMVDAAGILGATPTKMVERVCDQGLSLLRSGFNEATAKAPVTMVYGGNLSRGDTFLWLIESDCHHAVIDSK